MTMPKEDVFDVMFRDNITEFSISTTPNNPFYKDANGVALAYCGKIFFVFENPDDGYRSCAEAPLVGNVNRYEKPSDMITVRGLFSVISRSSATQDGIDIIDLRNGKTLLELGTDCTDDYYPTFVCRWNPNNLYENSKVSENDVFRRCMKFIQKHGGETSEANAIIKLIQTVLDADPNN
jgi:hypothetical protein